MKRVVLVRALAIAGCVVATASCKTRPATIDAPPPGTTTLQELSIEVDAGAAPRDASQSAFDRGRQLATALQLELPFPPGTVVLCAQGNQSPDGYTHALPQNQYSLDFAVRGLHTVAVTAAAAGVVTEIVDFDEDNLDAGDGYGRQVVIAHDGLETRYSHLEAISVDRGQPVAVHTPLGFMGHSGHAFERHLHFSLQVKTREGLRIEIPIAKLRAAGLGSVEESPLAPSQVHARSFEGDEFLAQPSLPWSGWLYASTSRNTSPSEQVNISKRAQQLRTTLRRRLVMERLIPELSVRSPAEVQRLLEPHLKADPHDPVTLYYRAVGVLIPKRRWSSAEACLTTAATNALRAEYYEGWLPGWIAAQRALVAKRRRSAAPTPISERERRTLTDAFQRALELFPSDELQEFVDHETRGLATRESSLP